MPNREKEASDRFLRRKRKKPPQREDSSQPDLLPPGKRGIQLGSPQWNTTLTRRDSSKQPPVPFPQSGDSGPDLVALAQQQEQVPSGARDSSHWQKPSPPPNIETGISRMDKADLIPVQHFQPPDISGRVSRELSTSGQDGADPDIKITGMHDRTHLTPSEKQQLRELQAQGGQSPTGPTAYGD